DMASSVVQELRHDGFAVTTSLAKGQTAVGTRTLETVTGTRSGQSGGSIVIVSHRDALHSPAVADLSGTAVMLELARVLSGETQHRSVVLASTSGTTGQAGAIQPANRLGHPVDAVIVLGDLAGRRVEHPLIVPWSNGPGVAPTMLRNTV